MLGHLGGKENWHSIDIILFSSYAWRLLAGRSAARKKMKYGKGSGRRCFGGGEIDLFLSGGCVGFHYAFLGYPSVDAYVAHMYTHEKAHLEAFGVFCDKSDLMEHLKSRNWPAFARGYNGPGFAANKYDIKLEAAYQKYITL